MRKQYIITTVFIIALALILSLVGFIYPQLTHAKSTNPVFSHKGGYYLQSFELELSVKDNAVIYYTLDGSEPTKNSKKYDSPIKIIREVIPTGFPTQIITKGVTPKFPMSYIETNPEEASSRMRWHAPEKEIFKATVVRAKAFHSNGSASDTITHTYFIDKNMNERYTFPVISLSIDINDLFDFQRGIYIPGKVYADEGFGDSFWGTPNANYHQRGRDWERSVHIEFYEPNGIRGFSLNGGLRIHGMGSRVIHQKSLRIYARSDYDSVNRIKYDIFQGLTKPGSDEVVNSFKRLVLRTGGQESYKTIFKDMFLQSLIDHTNIDIQGHRPSILFINGEYWGIHNIRQRYDLRYLESNYDVDTSDVAILDTAGGRLGSGESGDDRHFKDMLKYLRNNDMSQEKHYEHVKTLIDIDNYINYAAYNIYIGNYDWPSNNVNIWRYKSDYNPDAPYGLDGRWRWMVFDVDYGFGFKDVTYNTLSDITLTEEEGSEKRDWSTEIFRILIHNEEFKNSILNCFADHMNTTFNVDRVIREIDKFEQIFEPEIQEHIDRWNRYPRPDLRRWRESVEQLRDYARERPENILEHIAEAFEVEEISKLTVNILNPNYGTIRINHIEINENTPGISSNIFPWTGDYFKSIPVKVTALDKPGYVFNGWKELDDSSRTITLTLTEDTTLTALYVADPFEIMSTIDTLPALKDLTLKHKDLITQIRNELTNAINAGLNEKDIMNLNKLILLEAGILKLEENQRIVILSILLFTIIAGGATLFTLSRIQSRRKMKY